MKPIQVGLLGIFGLAYVPLLPSFARDVLGGDALVFGMVASTNAAGALCAALILALFGDRIHQVALAAADLLGARVVSVWIVDESAGALDLRACSDEALGRGQGLRRVAFGQTTVGEAAQRRATIMVDDAPGAGTTGDLGWSRARQLPASMTIPVLDDGRIVAVLAAHGREPLQIELSDKAREMALVLEASKSAERDTPDYLEVNEGRSVKLLRTPKLADVPYAVQMEPHLIVEFYSR